MNYNDLLFLTKLNQEEFNKEKPNFFLIDIKHNKMETLPNGLRKLYNHFNSVNHFLDHFKDNLSISSTIIPKKLDSPSISPLPLKNYNNEDISTFQYLESTNLITDSNDSKISKIK